MARETPEDVRGGGNRSAGGPIDPNAGAPPIVRAVLESIDRLSRLDGWIGALCLAALTTLMLAEVAVRALSNVFPAIPADIPVAWEYSSYLMAATFTFGAALTLRAGGHIRVNLITAQLGPGPRRALECLLALLGTLFVGFLAVSMVSFTWEAFARSQRSVSSGTLLWVPQAAVTFGLVLLALQFLARALQAALGLPLEDARIKAAPLE